MRLSKIITIIILVIITSLFFGCSAAQSIYGRSGGAPKEVMGGDYKHDRYAEKKSKSIKPDMKKEGGVTEKDEKSVDQPSERMIIYEAEYQVSVNSVKRSMSKINEIVTKYKGFIESAVTSDSYRNARIVIRVPVADFDRAVTDIETIGKVTGKIVSAMDVTMEFNDVSLRIDTAKRVRERMYELLKRVKKVKERVKILREIERLTAIIDSLTSRMNYLKDKASYSTITVYLRAMVRDVVKKYSPSPFGWIAYLKPYERSLSFECDALTIERIEGFFYLKKEFCEKRTSRFLFISPDQKNGVRIGTVDNYPPADLQFWTDAFEIDLKNRMYRVLSTEKIQGRLLFQNYTVTTGSGTVYSISFSVTGTSDKGKIIVVEAVFDNESKYKKNRPGIEKFIKAIGVSK